MNISLWSPYLTWLFATGLFCSLLEARWPWRQQAQLNRPQIWQDMAFLFLNGHIFGLFFATLSLWALAKTLYFFDLCKLPDPRDVQLLSEHPLWLQFIAFFLLKDLVEWLIHNLLHRVPWLWRFHQLHHSITTMDWMGNFRFHFAEIVVYRSLSWWPLVIWGVDERILWPMAIVTTLVGNLNHSNLKLHWGPLNKIFNSPRMHIWHHDVICHKRSGQNFAIVFSLWDWLFGTAWLPKNTEQPAQIGLIEKYGYISKQPLKYLGYPFFQKSFTIFEKGRDQHSTTKRRNNIDEWLRNERDSWDS